MMNENFRLHLTPPPSPEPLGSLEPLDTREKRLDPPTPATTARGRPLNVYLVGSLKCPLFPHVAEALREAGHEVFDDWRGAGHDGDLRWRNYEIVERCRNYVEALASPYATFGFEFDKKHLDACDVAVAVCKDGKLPGRSSIAELTYVRWGRSKPTYILLNGEPEEWDLMLPLTAHGFFYKVEDLITQLTEDSHGGA